MLQLTNKDLYQIQIAMKLDEYMYEKDTQTYFETMPHIGLMDSQVTLINNYIQILEQKDESSAFSKLLEKIREENAGYQKLLAEGSKSTTVKKYSRITAYLIRQMEKYNKLF